MPEMASQSEQVPGKIVSTTVMAPGGAMAWEVRKGQVLRLIDVEGQQVGDLVCFNLHRLEEKLSPPNTALLNRTIRLTTGHGIWSDEASLMLTIVADTVGWHDIIGGACSGYTNKLRYGKDATPNCRDNFFAALRPWGIGWKDVPYAFNVFMNLTVGADHSVAIDVPRSRAGDHVDFRAEMDVLVGISNCPQVLNPCNNYRLKPLKVIIYEPHGPEQA